MTSQEFQKTMKEGAACCALSAVRARRTFRLLAVVDLILGMIVCAYLAIIGVWVVGIAILFSATIVSVMMWSDGRRFHQEWLRLRQDRLDDAKKYSDAGE